MSEKVTKVFTKGATLACPHDQLFDNSGQPVDLSGKTLQFRMVKQAEGTVKVNNRPASATNPPGVDGRIQYHWVDADVDTAGVYFFWWIVDYAGKKNYFPPGHTGEIIIEDTY